MLPRFQSLVPPGPTRYKKPAAEYPRARMPRAKGGRKRQTDCRAALGVWKIQVADFSLWLGPHLVEGEGELSGTSFMEPIHKDFILMT